MMNCIHHCSQLPPLSPSSAVVINHISFHSVITLSDLFVSHLYSVRAVTRHFGHCNRYYISHFYIFVAATTCQSARADVVFLVDSSRSICGSDSSCSNWLSLLNFVNSIVNRFTIGNQNTRVGFVRYSSSAATRNEFYLNDNGYDGRRVADTVRAVQYDTGRSFVGDLVNALSVVRTQQFVLNRGDRIGAPNIIIVLMNGGVSVTTPEVSLQYLLSCLDLSSVFLDPRVDRTVNDPPPFCSVLCCPQNVL